MSVRRVLVARPGAWPDAPAGQAHDAAGADIALLRSHGHEIETIDTGPAGMRLALWSGAGTTAMHSAIARFRPEIVHLQGPGGVLSPSLAWAAAGMGLPVVLSLHDFGLACVQGGFRRAGRECRECLGHLPFAAVRHGCGAAPARPLATPMGLIAHRAAGTWERKIRRFIVPSEFARAQYIDAGFTAGRVCVKPPFTTAPFAAEAPPAVAAPAGQFVYLRSGAEDDGDIVLGAALRLEPSLSCLVVGEGPGLPGAHRAEARGAAEVSQLLERALALVVPGGCGEPFAQAAVTAFAHGLPVIGTRTGSLPEIVRAGKTGMLVEPGNAAELAQALRWARENPTRLQAMGRAARAEHQIRFSAQENYRQLLAVYHDALATTPL